jgi:hypothetical protein
MGQTRQLGLVLVAILLATACFASELAVLRNGFTIRHERRTIVGDMTRLYTGGDAASYVDIPTADIDHFEVDATPAPKSELPAPPVAVSAPLPAPAPAAKSLDQIVGEASDSHNIDPDFINSVIRAESGFNVRAVSPKGAQGLMQLMPGTASNLGVRNAFDPRANVDGGTRYLRSLLEKYNYDVAKALAAYNAGPKRVDQYHGIPPYYETQAYVARIIRDYNRKKLAQQKADRAHPAKTQVSTTTTRSSSHSKRATRATSPSSAPGAGSSVAEAR